MSLRFHHLILIAATMVFKEFNLIELEDYATQPVRLMAVRTFRLPTS